MSIFYLDFPLIEGIWIQDNLQSSEKYIWINNHCQNYNKIYHWLKDTNKCREGKHIFSSLCSPYGNPLRKSLEPPILDTLVVITKSFSACTRSSLYPDFRSKVTIWCSTILFSWKKLYWQKYTYSNYVTYSIVIYSIHQFFQIF